ncbi:MAG: hypothetical protein J6Y09_00665, partial [Lachnospiraceae bacterium]|nr:hypothetical protein [Lachnospiraceae bacterium]
SILARFKPKITFKRKKFQCILKERNLKGVYMQNTNVIDLSGEWLCESEDGSVNKKVKLPGSSCENGIGKKAEYYKEYSKEAVRAPREKYEFIGKLI